ncbi:hypothetical protein B0H17DRAFT_1208428 [Mycena rosella]|uniref:Uncharacterized protein n=1 Tax=Mycena rosella TaxID=1033263 RepID=A0AAD7G6W2_MYCRO|nr:hypothetical protein B0H17DRAFT_1208428 [Mycena rosella]
MRTLKRTGSAVSTSDIPPPKTNGRTHGPAEGDDDSAFWEPFPPPVAQDGTDDNGQPFDASSHEEVDALPPAPIKGTKTALKPATKQLGLSHFFGPPAASSSKSAAKEKEVANKKSISEDVARPVEKKGKGKAVEKDDPPAPVTTKPKKGKGEAAEKDDPPAPVAAKPKKGKGKAVEKDDPPAPVAAKPKIHGQNTGALSETERQAQRDATNAERREARHQLFVDDPEKATLQRRESGLSRSPMIGEVWAERYYQLATREVSLQTAAATGTTDLETVQAVVAAYCDAEGHLSIPAGAPVWLDFTPRTLQFLAAVAQNPTTWDPAPFLANNTIVISKRTDLPLTSICANYFRRIKVPGAQAIASLQTYLIASPADAPDAILKLLLQGEVPDSVQKWFRAAMVVHGLEDAVDVLFEAVNSQPATAVLLGTRRAASSTGFPYAGITTTVACGARCFDNLEGDCDIKLINFLKANEEKLEWVTYHVPDLDTRIDGPWTQKERVLRAILGASAMNSAPGGTQPIFMPSGELLDLQQRTLSLLQPLQPFPLGQARDIQLEHKICDLIDDEIRLLGPTHLHTIAPNALRDLKANVAGAVRLSNGRVVTVHIAKDLTLEGFMGNTGGYWAGDIGPGPQEDRHLRRMHHPEIPQSDDIPPALVARFIGPFLDFWRVTLLHILYWLHVLLLARLLTVLNPVLITSQSSPVAATLRSGDLSASWEFLPADMADDFLDGESPTGLAARFPKDVKYREYKGGDFNALLGTLAIVRTGRRPSQMSLHIAGGHHGRLKYDPESARARWDVDFCVQIVIETAVQMTAAQLENRPLPDWDDKDAVRGWMKTLKDDIEAVLSESGVSRALDAAKMTARRVELTLTFLRAVTASARLDEKKKNAGPGASRPKRQGILTKPSGERQAQLDLIVTQAQELDSFDLPPDPNHLGSFANPILSDSFAAWFMGLRDGIDVVMSSNALGRTREAFEALQEKYQAFGEWRRSTPAVRVVDTIGLARVNLVKSIKEVADADRYFVGELIECILGTLGKISDVLAELNLVAVPVRQIMTHQCLHWNGF